MSAPGQTAKDLRTLEWFVFRARRVAEHSLLIDREGFLVWAKGTMKFSIVPDGESTMTKPLPNEEAFESLAARCRPFMMLRDDLHFRKVLNALRPFLASDPERLAVVDRLSSSWEKLDPKSGTVLGLAAQTGSTGKPLGDLVPDTKLADAWLYCDFGHGDTDVVERVGEHDLDTRYQAAVLLVCNIALTAMATLNFIRSCFEAGLVGLGPEAFSDAVLAREEYTVTLTAVMTAPPGTPPEDFAAHMAQFVD